jgi:alkylresorcinol/alkylpyrone synthase
VLLPGRPGLPGADIIDAEQLTVPAHADDLQVHLGERGMRIRLAPSMPDVVSSVVRDPVDALLARNGIGRNDPTWWAVHPGGRRVLDRVDEALGLPDASMAVSRATMREYGNTAAPAVLGVVERMQMINPLGPGQHGVVLAFGPGATIWSLLLRGG